MTVSHKADFLPNHGSSHPVSQGVQQIARFLVVGVLNTLVDAGLYALLTRGLGLLVTLPVLAKGISYSAGVLNSFFWNRRWTFRSTSGLYISLPPFVLANLLGLVVNAGCMHFGLNILGLPETFSFGAATLITLVWNFLISKRIFRA